MSTTEETDRRHVIRRAMVDSPEFVARNVYAELYPDRLRVIGRQGVELLDIRATPTTVPSSLVPGTAWKYGEVIVEVDGCQTCGQPKVTPK